MSDENQTHGTVEVPVSGRSVMQLLAFVIGGALSGGGVSYYTSPGDDFREMRAEIREELNDAAKRFERVALDITTIASEVKQDRRDIIRLENELRDLEVRTRTLETAVARKRARKE